MAAGLILFTLVTMLGGNPIHECVPPCIPNLTVLT